MAPRGMGGLPSVITDAEIDSVVAAADRVVGELAPTWSGRARAPSYAHEASLEFLALGH